MDTRDVGTTGLTLDGLRSRQLERLRTTLHSVYEHVPHYRRAFDGARVRPDDLEELGDLARFPLTTKGGPPRTSSVGCAR
jgi:phenylacetate-CoA ligase